MRARFLVYGASTVLTATLVVGCDSSADETASAGSVECGVIDATALRETVRLPEMRVNTFTGLREIPNDTIVEQLKQGTWECTFSWPGKGTLALKLSDDVATTGVEISRPDTVSLGRGLDGAVHADQLNAVLPGAKDGSTTWHVWESPGDAFPSTACQIWRKRDPSIDPPVNEDEPAYLLGPRVGFSRITGSAAANHDLTKSRELLHHVEPWNRFGGKGYHADNQARNKNKDNEMRLKRACGDETRVYVGAYAPHTVTRAQYEKLFTQWVQAQAQRDGCPVT